MDALWDLAAPASTSGGADDARRHQPVAAGRRPLQARWEQLAAAGPRPGQFRDDASLARWYVVQAAVRAGWAGEEWVAAIAGWPWLAGQYSARPDLALYEFEKAAGQWRLRGHVQIPDTSRYFLHGGGQGQSTTPRDQPQPEPLHRRLRQVRTWLQGTARSGRMSPAVHAVGRAVLLFAHAAASHRIQVGVRALAVAAAVSRTTAAAALWELEAAGLISRAGRGIGRGADVWEIDLALGEGLRPAAGRLWATRPVFRIIGGHGTAEVYEVLAGAGGPLSARQVAGMLGRSPTTVAGNLHELGAWGLAVGGGRDGWAIGPADPDELAVRLRAYGLVAAQVAGYRAERAAWWAWLEAKGLDRPGRRTPGPGRVVLLPPPPRQQHQAAARGDRAGPNQPEDAAIIMLHAVLGATVLALSAPDKASPELAVAQQGYNDHLSELQWLCGLDPSICAQIERMQACYPEALNLAKAGSTFLIPEGAGDWRDEGMKTTRRPGSARPRRGRCRAGPAGASLGPGP